MSGLDIINLEVITMLAATRLDEFLRESVDGAKRSSRAVVA